MRVALNILRFIFYCAVVAVEYALKMLLEMALHLKKFLQ